MCVCRDGQPVDGGPRLARSVKDRTLDYQSSRLHARGGSDELFPGIIKDGFAHNLDLMSQELRSVKVVRRATVTLSDKLAAGLVKLSR